MKVTSVEESDFCLVQFPTSTAANYIQYTIPKVYRFFQKAPMGWRVHKDFIVQTVQLGYGDSGHVDYSQLDEEIQMVIAQEKTNWKVKDNTSKIIPAVKNKDLAYASLFLTPGAPEFILNAVWKALAREHHPDRGGDEETFKAFKEAYDLIKGKN